MWITCNAIQNSIQHHLKYVWTYVHRTFVEVNIGFWSSIYYIVNIYIPLFHLFYNISWLSFFSLHRFVLKELLPGTCCNKRGADNIFPKYLFFLFLNKKKKRSDFIYNIWYTHAFIQTWIVCYFHFFFYFCHHT